MKSKILHLLTVLLLATSTNAQVKVGDNPTTINSSAVLDAESTTRGFLPPRMTQAQMNAIAAPAAGLIVYCTDCNPVAHYTFNGSTWNVLGAATNPNATFASGTLSCSGALAGSYVQYTPMNSSNTKTVTIFCNSAGTVTGNTNTANGVSFSVNTTLYSTGPGTQITLTATGTPLSTGVFAYTATVAGQTCSFNVTFADAATFACGSITHTLPASLVNGTSYNSSSVLLPYTAGTGAAYPTTTVTSNGLTLTRVAGNYAAGGGTVVYDLSGTYTGATGGNAVFTLPDGGCIVSAGAATFSGSPSCGTPVGNYISTVAMTAGNTVPITLTASAPGGYSITSTTANGVTFAGSGSITAAGTQAVTLTATGTPVSNGYYSYTITVGGQNCSFTVYFKPVNSFAVGAISASTGVLSIGTNISWTAQLTGNGVSISGTNITLLAGKTYRLSASLAIGNSGWAAYQFVNSSNTQLTGTAAGYSLASAQNSAVSSTVPAQGIYTVGASNETVRIRIVAVSQSPIIYSDGLLVSSVTAEEIPASISYAVGTITASTGVLPAGTNVSWSSQLASNGASVSGTDITLLAGKTYRLSASLSIGNSGYASYRFVNSSNTALTGTCAGYSLGSAQNLTITSMIPAQGIYTVGASNEIIRLRIVSASQNPIIFGAAPVVSSVMVEEIPASAAYAVARINTPTGILSANTNVSWNSQVAGSGVTISGTDITLLAGKTYSLTASLSVASSGWAGYKFVNSSNTALAGVGAGYSLTAAQNTSVSSTVPACGVYTVGATNETIRLRIVAVGNNPTIYADAVIEPSVVIKEIK
jgi:hypothetical protein